MLVTRSGAKNRIPLSNAPTNRRAWDCEAIMNRRTLTEIRDAYVTELKKSRRDRRACNALARMGYQTSEIDAAITADIQKCRREAAEEIAQLPVKIVDVVNCLLELY